MIFLEDNTSFSFNVTPLKSLEELGSGVWLTLVGTNEVPPHIALISEGKYYSLSTRKVDYGNPLERFINTLERKHIPTLFIRIENANVIARNEAISVSLLLEKIYKNLQPLVNTQNTCLSPIKDFFAANYSNEFATINYVFELIAMAQKQGLIRECISLFCENTTSNIVTLPKYTITQIRKRIKDLSSQITSA